MRKKIYSILVGILLVFAGVFVSACGDKYKNFEFKITYAFSEDAENWYNAKDGISLNYLYDESSNEYVFDINGKEERVDKNDFNIYVKVDIKNVKSKHLDSITVSAEGSSGLSFTSSTIKKSKTITLPIVGLVNSELKFYENKSGKSTTIDLSVYGKLTEITRNENITPAVVVNNSLDLNSIRDLIYYNKDGITTNQTGVDYEVDEFGSFTDSGVFVSDGTSNNVFVSLTNGRLKLNKKIRAIGGEREFNLTSSNNVIKVKATSKYSPVEPTADNPEIATDIYVYIVENNLGAPIVTFDNGTNVNNHLDSNGQPTGNSGLDLYFTTNEELVEYTKSTVNVENALSVYGENGIKTADGRTLKFKTVIYMGNSLNPYNFETLEPIKDLIISKNNNSFTLTLAKKSIEKQVDVKFGYQLVCTDEANEYPVTFTEAQPNLKTNVIVRKHALASAILVNGETYSDGSEISGVVYSTTNPNYQGYKLQVGVDQLDQHNPQKTTISGIDNLFVTDNNGFVVNNNESLPQDKILKIKFKNNVYNEQTAVISVLKTPTYFNGKAVADSGYISVNLILTRQVTADALEFVEPIDANNFKEVSSINVATNKTSYIFLKAYHKGLLETSTITITSSNFALNTNSNKMLLLSDFEDAWYSSDEGYTIYKLAIPATETISSSNVMVYAGELGNGASKEVVLNSVDLINNANNIEILPKSTTDVENFGKNRFAIVKGQDTSFNVVEHIDTELVHKTIQGVTLTSVSVTDEALKRYFGDAEVLTKTEFKNSNVFNVYGWNEKTRVFNVNVKYYQQIDVNDDGVADVISLQTKIIENVQFAIYNPITSITMSVTNPKVTYVNSMFPEAATTEIRYSSYSGVGAEVPSQSVFFMNEEKTGVDEQIGATSVQISIDKDLKDVNQVKLMYLTGVSYSPLENDKILLANAKNSGTLKLQLTNSYTRDNNIKFIVTAKRFGKIASTQKDISVTFANVERAEGFNVEGGDLIEYSSTNRELQLSFMGVVENTVSKNFTATPIYASAVPAANTLQFKDITYLLYKYSYVDGVQQFEADGVTPKLIPISNFDNGLKIAIDNGKITVTADKTIKNIGGIYKLVIATKDSYIDGTFTNTYSVNVRVSDGKTLDAAYIITTPEQFMDINNDLAAHYVLGNNITISSDKFTNPIGYNEEGVLAFTGTLSGRLQTYTESGISNISNHNIVVTINEKSKESTDYGHLFGLFTILNGTISNLNIHIGFSNSISTVGKSTIGGIVAVNRGTIKNVYAYLSGNINIGHETNFGGIVGNNEGSIENCIVDSSNAISITASATANIGGVVGLNNGTIIGKYQGKEDLNEIVYDVVANILVINTVENVSYDIGAVVGESTTDISNILVGGTVSVNSEVLNASPTQLLKINGYLGGIVGNTSANVSTVAGIGLDLVCESVDAGSGIKVAGIAGYAKNITDARFVSVLAKHSFGSTLGSIIGKEVAGIAYYVTSGIMYSTVESFIETLTDKNTGDKSTFYTIEGTTAYGLVATGSVSNSFVRANIDATEVYLTSGSINTEETYFIGKTTDRTPTICSTYSVVYNDSDFVSVTGFTNTSLSSYVVDGSLIKSDWETNLKTVSGFKISETKNVIKLSNYPNVEFYFPYIEKDGQPLMIIQPSSIGVAINQNYQIDTEANVYIDKVEIEDDKTPPTYEIKESIIVDYFENQHDNNSDINKHRLINSQCKNCKEGKGACLDNANCHKGLIDMEILPPGAVGGLSFELVANYVDIATIEYDTESKTTFIKFSGVTDDKPVIVRVYSVFNAEAEAYFAIYTQSTFTKFVLKGANIETNKTADADYIANIYKGKNSLISISADNYVDDTYYNSIFTNNSHYIKVEKEIKEEDKNKIEVKTDNLTAMSLSILDEYTIENNGEVIDLVFNIYLDKSYFGDLHTFEEDEIGLLLGTVKLRVKMFNIASDLVIVGANDFEIDSSSTLNFEANLKTGYVDVNDSTTEEVKLSTKVVDEVVIVGESSNKDYIKMKISSSSEELVRIKRLTNSASYAELFDINVYNTRYDEGYKYYIDLSLKDEMNYRYITSEIDLVLEIWADSVNEVQNSVQIKIKPTTASTTRLVNYAVQNVNTISSTKSELTIGNIETSIISPGGRGNIMLAYVEKSYANIDKISITSSDLYVPEKGKNVNLIFTQYVYNIDTRKFETLFNADVQSQDGKTLELQKATTINNAGTTEYTGLLYIHVQLIKFSGLEARITASLNVTSNGKELPVVTKDLLTTFLPGASLNYIGKEIDNGYLIQEETYANSAKIRLYGYQFNANPTIISNWELVDGVDYFYHIDGTDNKEITTEDIDKNFADGTLYFKESDKYYKANVESDKEKTGVTFYSITNKKILEIGGTQYHVADYVTTYLVKNYQEVDYNSVDGSYTMEVKFNIAKNIPTSFSLQAGLSLITSEGQLENAKSDKITFYPTQYIVTNVAVKNTSGNRKMLAINRTDKFELLFSTNREDYDYSSVIYENNFLSDISNLAELFSYYNPTEKTFADKTAEFDVAERNGYLNIIGLSKFEKAITLKIWVGYTLVNGKYEIEFNESAQTGMQLLEYSFLLQIYPGAGEENATPIYYAYEMFGEDGTCKLAENGHYILMNDIELDLVKPIDYAIGSLDGNNHIIKIKNFVIDKSKTEYGLFANIGTYQDEESRTHKTILKNVIVDYSEFNAENNGNLEFTNNQIATVKFGGLVATNNGGLIYNCDVINSNPATDKNINILTDANANLTFGGLVADNKGIVTNSRVGRKEFKDIDAKTDTYINTTFGGLTFTLGSGTSSGFNVVSGGFVGVNSGTISSSYFANSYLINYSNSKDLNITAGFAGKNTKGTIVYSYVKAKETTITSTSPYSTGARIENKSNGIVAGFVYENSGNINDCYANTELKTDSTYIAGFVYKNISGATISESYAACTMNSGSSQDNAEQPFLGKDNEDNYLNAGTMYNNYYLIGTSGSGDVNSTVAQALNATNFSNPDNLQGFVFVQSNVIAERQQGVWSHIDVNNNSVILPELMNANLIAHSAKYLHSGDGIENKFVYTNAESYIEGSANNPYVIRNVNEFNNILTGDRVDMSAEISTSGYVRLIDNIDFAEDQDAIKTRVKYSLGDKNKSNLTSFEGNGLSISGIYFDVSEPGIKEIGLFATINNAYVKNLNLNFAKPKSGGQYSTTLVKYSGGLAGVITNSAIINVNLNGKNVALTGENYVGAVAGLVKGNSLLYGITSNLSVVASSPNSGLYYSKEDFVAMGNSESAYNYYVSNLSYAGGVAGVIDISKRANTEYNMAYIDIHGDQMFVKTSENGVQLPNITAQYAGGVAGFVSKNSSALKLKYHIGTTDWINGSMAAGGLFGVSLGKLKASQVTAVEDIQFGYDEGFGKYILDINNQDLNQLSVGNLNLIESNNYAGGLIGIGLNAGVDSSYSKASIKQGKVVGGLIGASIASNVVYAYALPFVNITDITAQVGGLFGSASIVEKDVNYTGDKLKEYKELVKLYLNKEEASSRVTYTDIQYTFSTLLLNKINLIEKSVNSNSVDSPKLNYLVPNDANKVQSGGSGIFSNIYTGNLDDYAYVNGSTVNPVASNEQFKSRDLKILYDLTHLKQETTFNEIFSAWKAVSYWTIKHEKYFPLLTNEGVENYIIIEDADDMQMIAANPDGKYLVVNDIDMGPITGNWVFDINFTGELIGQMDSESGARKKIKNISLTPNRVDSSGFFKSTQGAMISDLEFVWNDDGDGAIDSSTNLTNVSGLSCYDTFFEDGENTQFSEFNNVEVSVSGGGYLLKYPRDAEGTIIDNNENPIKLINKFGGIVAKTSNSTILNCDFVGKVETCLSKNSELDNNKAHFGGLVGYAEKLGSDENIENSSMTIMNSQIGANGEDSTKTQTTFDIKIVGNGQAMVGGLAGEIDNTSILGVKVGDINNENANYKTISINIKTATSNSQNIGGLVGYASNSAISASDVDASINICTMEDAKAASTVVAGLVANYSETEGKADITNSNAKTYIDVSKLTTSALYVSGGIGLLETSNITNGNINQCLFTGKIESEKEETPAASVPEAAPTTINKLSATTIVAGGAIASSSGNATINETMTTVDITIGTKIENPHTLKAGGFVGSINNLSTIALNKVVSSGKLVPFCGNNAIAVHLGGMIGSVDDTANAIINNSYTLTSIIADGVAGNALQYTHSDALVGYAKATINATTGKATYNATANNVYFSTDFALTTNDKNLGTNVSAYDFVYDTKNVWANDFVSSQANVWKNLEAASRDGRLPYLKALEDNLKKYKVLEVDSGQYDYVSGSSLRPLTTVSEFKTDFTYYILNAVNGAVSGKLNGVLIGKEDEFNIATTDVVATATAGASKQAVALIDEILTHSAVSNIHLTLDENQAYTISDSVGLITNTNNGLIFNSSVNGKQVSITGGTSLGLLTAVNNGTVSYSYSSAEITDVTSLISGIVDTNAGVINSCYFTGYINNTTTASGIVRAVSEDKHYVYNSYMAGVVEIIDKEHTSFYAGNVNDLEGLNNYIDQYANIELNINLERGEGATKYSVLKSVTTAELMSATVKVGSNVAESYLKGVWFKTVSGVTINGKNITNGRVNTSANYEGVKEDVFSLDNVASFGKNYGYPIYRFNKITSSSSGDSIKCADLTYSLDTGTGKTEQITVSDMYSQLTTVEKEYYNAYKIPHLGVLTVVHGLQADSKNYVVIYDIDGLMQNWIGVGSETDSAHGFTNTGAFRGVFITNRYLNNSTTSDSLCTIQGLNNHGLFNEIGSSYIADIELGSFGEIAGSETQKGLQNSGAIGVNVIDATNINNVIFTNNSIIKGNNIGGLFGSVVAEVTITNFSSKESAADLPALTLQGSGSAGLIASSLGVFNGTAVNVGTINLDTDSEVAASTSTEPAITNALFAFFKGVEIAGGLVGEVNGGTINGNGNIINIDLNLTDAEVVKIFGGIVGRVTENCIEATINKVNVNFYQSEAVITANSFGGFVGLVDKGICTFADSILTAEKTTINSYDYGQRGMLVGEIKSTEGKTGSVTITNFVLTQKTGFEFNNDASNSSIGGIVGKQDGDLTLSYSNSKPIELTTKSTTNMGGIIGYYVKGNICVYEHKVAGSASTASGDAAPITLTGKANVGGFIGYAESFPIITAPEGIGADLTSINFLNCNKYANIIITTNSNSNFGGIFGVLKASNISSTGEVEATLADEIEYYETINNNSFEIDTENKPTETIHINNIGGVVGLAESPDGSLISLGKLTNEAKLDFSKALNYQFTNVGGIIGKFVGASIEESKNEGKITSYSIEANEYISSAENETSDPYAILMNVGGIVGFVDSPDDATDNTTLKTLTNSAAISGYQNVGSLVGYALKAGITGTIKLEDGDKLSYNATDGKFVVKTSNADQGEVSLGDKETSDVAGVINVGGAVGYSQESTITNVYSASNVYGNANVGGLIGLSNENTIINNIVGNPSGDGDHTEIQAIYYNAFIKGSSTDKYITYIPTSVGGLIGTSFKTEINSNIISAVDILSTHEGSELGSAKNNSKGMISTIKNYMANIGVTSGSAGIDEFTKSDKLYYLGSEGSSKVSVKFQEMTSGFGGFVGTIDSTADISQDIVDSEDIKERYQTSYMKDITINAPLGINVGTYFGVYNHDDENFKVPTLYGEIKIDGAYNVGGIAGKINGELTDFSNEKLAGNAIINLQSNLSGMYVGGLFGVLESQSVMGIKIVNSNVNLKIHTDSSYYLGGLIGKLQVSQGNKFENCDSSGVGIVGNDAQNFGGLVGMLKCVGGVGTYSVKGIHNYPFTVNTIENQNYAEGSSQYDTYLDDNSNSVQLLAQAYYINQDSFNISATNNPGIYSSTANNPVRVGDSTGWAKEYTGFKQLQRCIPADQNNGEWDSIAFVYNAENITHVATLANKGLTKTNPQDYYCSPQCAEDHTHTTILWDEEKHEYCYKGDNIVYMGDDGQFIIYTVYEKAYGMPLLYCPAGIAELAKMQDNSVVDEYTDLYSNEQENKWEADDEKGNRKGLTEYYFERSLLDNKFAGTNDELKVNDKGYKNILQGNKVESLLRFNWAQLGTIGTITWYSSTDGSNVDRYESRKGLNYAYYLNLDGKYYDFKVIYANNTLNSSYDVQTDLTKDLCCPESGSVFEISGINPEFKIDGPHEYGGKEWPWWVSLIIAIVAVVLIVIAFVFPYVGVPALAAIAKFVGMTTVVGAIIMTGLLAVAILGWCGVFNTQGNVQSAKLFFNTVDQNLGLMTTTTITEIKYKDNKMVSDAIDLKTFIDVDGTTYDYQYYSKVRPDDFYVNYYITSDLTEDEIIAMDENGKSLTKGLSSEEYQLDVNEDSKLIYKITDTSTGKDLIYAYHYGTSSGTEVNAYPKYVYSEGSYYLNTLGFKYGYYQTNELTHFDNITYKKQGESTGHRLEDSEMYVSSEGIGYVRGDYNSNQTTVEDTYTYRRNIYTDNLMKYDEASGQLKLNGVDLAESAYADVPISFICTGDEDGEDTDGYNYMKGAYYTTKGNVNTRYIKYATYTYYSGEIDSSWIEGVDYIKANYTLVEEVDNGSFYKDGETYKDILDKDDNGDGEVSIEEYNGQRYNITPNQQVFLKIASMAENPTETASATSKDLGYQKNIEGITIELPAYPTCFNDPYIVKPLGIYKDEYTYMNSAIAYEGLETNPSLLSTVRYFYYESGYKLGSDFSYVESDYINSIFTPSTINTEMATQTIELYHKDYNSNCAEADKDKKDSNGLYINKPNKVEYKKLFMTDEGGAVIISGENSTYLNYYTGDPVALGALKEAYKLRNKFAVSDHVIYMRNDLYKIKDGKLYKGYKYNTKQDEELNKLNKYLSNKEYSLYTMFKYVDNEKDFKYEKGNSVWEKDDYFYYLIPTTPNRSNPNSYITYLVETAKVTLGGGMRLNHTGRGSCNVGTITIE